MPQGALKSQSLYNVYVNDSPSKHDIKLAKLAAIKYKDNNPHTVIDTLQNHLKEYSEWLKKWRIKVNPRMSAAILFTLQKCTHTINIILNNEPIPSN